MKRLLCIFTALCISLSLFNSIVALAGTTDPFEGKTDVVISTIGGSLTVGDGAGDYSKAWAQKLVSTYLPSKYPGKNFILKNAGIGGTTSEFGMLRFQNDVTAWNPDMVFIEFSVNDKWFPILNQTEELKRNLESLIQQCKALPSHPYVAFVVLTTWENLPAAGDIHKEIADYYGIPVLDLRSYIQDEVLAEGGDYDYCDLCVGKTSAERLACPNHNAHGRCSTCYKSTIEEALACPNIAKHSLFFKISGDGTHPRAEGYQIYYDRITQLMDENPELYYKKPADKPLLYTDSTSVKGLANLKTNNFDNIQKTADWMVGTKDYVGPTGTRTKTYVTSTLGAKLDIKFHGNTFCLFAFRGSDLGSCKVTIDKGTANEVTKTFTQYYETSLGYGDKSQQTVSIGGLSNEWHTAEIENIENLGVPTNPDTVLKNQTVMAYYTANPGESMPSVKNIYVDGIKINPSTQQFVPLGAHQIDIDFNGWFDVVNSDYVSLTSGGAEVAAAHNYDASANRYSITLNEPENTPGKIFTLTLSGQLSYMGTPMGDDIVYRFTTESGLKLSDLSFTDEVGGMLEIGNIDNVKFSIKATNVAQTGSKNLMVILAHKDKNGRLLEADVDKKEVTSGNFEIFDLLISPNSISSGDYCQVFVLEEGSLSPVTMNITYSLDELRIISIGDDVAVFAAKTIALKDTVSELSAKTINNSIKVTGVSQSDVVSILVMNKSGDITYLNTVSVTPNVPFEITCKLNNPYQEIHTVCVSSK